jgi:hypothetical protein
MSYTISIEKDLEKIKENTFLYKFLSEFKKPPFENIFYKYADYLTDNSEKIEFKNTWNYNPFLAAYEIYGEKYFYPILFVVNKIPYSIFFFTGKYIDVLKFPPLNIIKSILEEGS